MDTATPAGPITSPHPGSSSDAPGRRFGGRRRRGPAVTLAALAALAVSTVTAGCGGGSSGSGDGQAAGASGAAPRSGSAAVAVAVSVTADGCSASPASVPAGPVSFTVRNVDADDVSEIELSRAGDDDILASRENLMPGSTRTFSVRLAAGSYSLGCEGAKNEAGPLAVTGSAAAPTLSAAQQAIATSYHTYAVGQAGQLVTKTKVFTDAIRAGDMTAAMNAYGPAHLIYENIEFVGDHVDDGKLDMAIDARETAAQEGDGDQTEWTGFHRLEKMLWGDRSLTGAAPLATRLDTDIAAFRDLLGSHSFTPVELANGAAASIDETLEVHLPALEDHYSHTGLWDVAGKVESANQIFTLLRPTVEQADNGLAEQVQTELTGITGKLATLRTGDRYIDYSTVADPDRKALIATATRLDDALSKVPALVV